MQQFAKLLDQLYFTYSHLGKQIILKNYFANTPDPERGFAVAIITGALSFPLFKRGLIKELIFENVDDYLFELSYDYVGDLSETVALLWPGAAGDASNLPRLSELIEKLNNLNKSEIKNYLKKLLNNCNTVERWALIKLGTGGLRVGVSVRFIKQALALYGNQDLQDIEKMWHALQPPYTELFLWLEGKIAKPDISQHLYFHPVMLAHPLAEDELEKISPDIFAIEKKFDGIRVQVIITKDGKAVYSRTGDDISKSFPDITHTLSEPVVLDGELVVMKNTGIGSFNDLQQRLNRKAPSKKMLDSHPAHIILYDILSIAGNDLRSLPYTDRRQQLQLWFEHTKPYNMSLSPLLTLPNDQSLSELKRAILSEQHVAVEGLMLKRKDSPYIAGRPTGHWYKWKREAYLVDAVLMYAQRGHGKRSSFYSDYTFGLWGEEGLLPIGKAYSGFTDEELKILDKWIRHHTIHRFGPVREVDKSLVLEIAFEGVNTSSRHKSGYALRFPRINRIRWDKPALEADKIYALSQYVTISE